MAVYTVRTRDVHVVGKNWYGQTVATTYDLPKDIPAARLDIFDWLCTHAGDFQRIDDFAASIEEVEIPWTTEEGELAYYDCFSEEQE